MKTYYEILNVDDSATDEEIKNSYRNLAKKYHPDNNSKDPIYSEKMAEINEAYRVLSKERDLYDKYLSNFYMNIDSQYNNEAHDDNEGIKSVLNTCTIKIRTIVTNLIMKNFLSVHCIV